MAQEFCLVAARSVLGASERIFQRVQGTGARRVKARREKGFPAVSRIVPRCERGGTLDGVRSKQT
jgi:hypothetical protein